MDLSNPYRVMAERFPQGIVFLFEEHDELRYTFVDGEGLDDIGLTKDELESGVVAEGRPPDVRETLRSNYRRALDGEEVSFTVEAEGRHFRLQLRPVTDETGAVTAGVGFATDITEQEIYRRELEAANDRLEQYTQLLFHDLRNPVNLAQGRFEMLLEETDSEHADVIASALDRIESLTDTDMTLVTELDPDDLETVTLESVARSAWQNVATKAATLQIETDLRLRVDAEDMRRLFENLFRNSVEHGGEDVTITVGDLDNGFYFEDDGSGIPAAVQDTLFERGVTDSESGTGLGLFIVGSVVGTHGWEISATESEAGGARFEITGVETSPDR